jgi:hypothetical protein
MMHCLADHTQCLVSECFALKGVGRSPKHPEDHEQVDHGPNYHCIYYKVHEQKMHADTACSSG